MTSVKAGLVELGVLLAPLAATALHLPAALRVLLVLLALLLPVGSALVPALGLDRLDLALRLSLMTSLSIATALLTCTLLLASGHLSGLHLLAVLLAVVLAARTVTVVRGAAR